MTAPSSRISLRYMSRFACLGPACEDHCCHSWQVHVDQAHHARIRRELRRAPQVLQRFESGCTLLPAPVRKKRTFARLQMLPSGLCPMLDEDRLCALQRTGGEVLLPDICAVFPRFQTRVRTRIEVTGVLSCPEVTRLCLLHPDATDIIDIGPEMLRRPEQIEGLDPKIPAELLSFTEAVRSRMHALLGLEDFPLESRMYFVLELVNQLRPLALDSPVVPQILTCLGEVDLLLDLHKHFRDQCRRMSVNLDAVAAALTLIAGKLPQARFTQLATSILRSYLPASALSETDEVQVPIAQLVPEYLRRREVVLGAFADRVNLYFQNYLRHLWMREWYPQLAGLDGYVRSQVLRLALLRFLLLGHPEAERAAGDAEGGQQRLDQLAVQLVYTLSRAVDSASDVMEGFHKTAVERIPDLNAAIRQLMV
ncbi:MAG: flagellin lysine-N-methylase [Myxococcales bacterium]|nr:flagellin lysine-N-methylase [Myxococcales bacterium]